MNNHTDPVTPAVVDAMARAMYEVIRTYSQYDTPEDFDNASSDDYDFAWDLARKAFSVAPVRDALAAVERVRDEQQDHAETAQNAESAKSYLRVQALMATERAERAEAALAEVRAVLDHHRKDGKFVLIEALRTALDPTP